MIYVSPQPNKYSIYKGNISFILIVLQINALLMCIRWKENVFRIIGGFSTLDFVLNDSQTWGSCSIWLYSQNNKYARVVVEF